MKKLATCIVLLFTLSATAQSQKRQSITGEINVTSNDNVQGIVVYNLSSGNGTYTDSTGDFSIPVKAGDKLVFSSLQYQQFTVIVTKKLIAKGKLNITLNEGNTQLEEIVIKPDLTGDISVDVRKLDSETVDLPSDREINRGAGHAFRPDSQTKVDNEAIDKGYLRNGLNFVNIFRALFKEHEKSKPTENLEVKVHKIYTDKFFQKNLNIDRKHINDFIYYVESHGLTDEMLQKGNNLKLIQFLIQKSKDYKALQKD